jgi:hypothetical protein
MVIKCALEFDDTIREKISEIFVETFEKELSFISKNKETLIKDLAHIFVLDNIYIAITDNEIVGIIGAGDKGCCSIQFKIRTLIEHLGIIKGLLVKMRLKRYISAFPKYSIEKYEKISSIEFFAVDRNYAKMGSLLEMLKEFLSFTNTAYIIQVEEIKREVLRFYTQLGFKEIYREKYLFPKSIVKNNIVYMLYDGDRPLFSG